MTSSLRVFVMASVLMGASRTADARGGRALTAVQSPAPVNTAYKFNMGLARRIRFTDGMTALSLAQEPERLLRMRVQQMTGYGSVPHLIADPRPGTKVVFKETIKEPGVRIEIAPAAVSRMMQELGLDSVAQRELANLGYSRERVRAAMRRAMEHALIEGALGAGVKAVRMDGDGKIWVEE